MPSPDTDRLIEIGDEKSGGGDRDLVPNGTQPETSGAGKRSLKTYQYEVDFLPVVVIHFWAWDKVRVAILLFRDSESLSWMILLLFLSLSLLTQPE